MPFTNKNISLLLGIFVPTTFFLLLFLVFLCRRWRLRHQHGQSHQNHSISQYTYNKINHELDDEEIEFKRMLETNPLDSNTLEYDNTQHYFDSLPQVNNDEEEDFEGFEDYTFNDLEKDRLQIIEKLRSNLMTNHQ